MVFSFYSILKGFPFLDIKIVTLNTFKINLDSFGKKESFSVKFLGLTFDLPGHLIYLISEASLAT